MKSYSCQTVDISEWTHCVSAQSGISKHTLNQLFSLTHSQTGGANNAREASASRSPSQMADDSKTINCQTHAMNLT